MGVLELILSYRQKDELFLDGDSKQGLDDVAQLHW